MADKVRKSIGSEYMLKLDTGEDFFHLFAEEAEVFSPR